MPTQCHTRVLALAIAGAILGPGTVQAQVMEMNSSASAYCIGADCRTLHITTGGDDHLFSNLYSVDSFEWALGHVFGEQPWGGDRPWIGTVDRPGLSAIRAALIGTDPIFFGTMVQSWSTGDVAQPPDFIVRQERWTEGDRKRLVFRTTVPGDFPVTTTPEPASMMLMGFGLAAVMGAARRRRAAR